MFRPWSLCTLLVILLVVTPVAWAVPPAPTILTSSFSADGQDITGISLDPSGEFVAAVVNVDVTPVSGIPLPQAAAKKDIYPCDFGLVGSTQALGCRSGLKHDSSTLQRAGANRAQTVAYTSYTQPGVGLAPFYAVGGPGDALSLWSALEDTHRWEKAVTDSPTNFVVNVSIAPDASRIVAAISLASAGGRVVNYDRAGNLQWSYDFSDKPTSLAYARTGGLLVVGTAGGLFFLKPAASSAPASSADTFAIDPSASVSQVAISRDGDAVVAATSHGILYSPIANGTPAVLRWTRNLDPSGAQRVALSLDGTRFAAAAGNTIHFYRTTNNSFLAEEIDAPYATSDGSTFTDLAYDAGGSLLVAIAGPRVFGFGPNTNQPVWTFDATDAGRGGLDLPLKRVLVSDGAERIIVAGKTRLMPFKSLVSATAAFDQPGPYTIPPGTTAHLTFHVTNTGSVADTYTFISNGASSVGWAVRGPDSVTVAPDETASLNVSVDAPAGVSPGFYGVGFDVRSANLKKADGTPSLLASPALNLTVPRAVVLNLTAEDRIPNLHVGADVTVPVTIRNRGNADGVVNLTQTQALSRGSSWPIRLPTDPITVPAGGEKTVNMIVTAPEDAASGDRNDITIHAKEGTTVEATKLVTVYVDPKFEVHVTSTNSSFDFTPGELKQIRVTVLNSGNTDDIYNVSATITPASVLNDWRITLDHERVSVARGAKGTVIVTVRPGVPEPRDATLLVKAASNGSGETVDDTMTLSLLAKPAVTTPTKSFLPDLAPLTVAGIVALVAFARAVGGRRK